MNYGRIWSIIYFMIFPLFFRDYMRTIILAYFIRRPLKSSVKEVFRGCHN